MCRLLGYVGEPVTLGALLLEPKHSLLRQSWAPRHQTHGLLNADGFGAGWWAPEVRAEPAVYRRAQPIWSDATFASIAGLIGARAIVAAVRSATPGFPIEEVATQPFADGRYLFAHNGTVEGFRDGIGEQLRATLTPARAGRLRSTVDSEVLFAMIMDRVAAGAEPGAALADVVHRVKGVAEARLNMLLGDGEVIWASVFGNSLFTRSAPDTVIVASEPFDDDPAWHAVPELSVVRAAPGSIDIAPL